MPVTVDLQELVDDFNDDIAMLRGEQDKARERARDAETPKEYDEADADYSEAKQLEKETESARDRVRNLIDEWGGSTFRIRELSWGDRQRIDDMVRAETVKNDLDDTTAMIGSYKLAFVNRAVESTPPDAPIKAASYPDVVGEWLYEKASEVNDGGMDGDLANFSLQDEIPRPDGPQSSSTGE